MKKAIIITGPPRSGKTFKAHQIASQFSNDEVMCCYFAGQNRPNLSYVFNECTPETKLIVLEELNKNTDFSFYFDAMIEGLTINKKGKVPFVIHPQFIFTCNTVIYKNDFKNLGDSFKDRFDVIEMKDGIMPCNTAQIERVAWDAAITSFAAECGDDMSDEIENGVTIYKTVNDYINRGI